MSLTEIVQQLLDRIENHPIDGKAAVIVAVGCWLWAEFIEFLETRRMRRRFSRPQMAGTPPAGDDRLAAAINSVR